MAQADWAVALVADLTEEIGSWSCSSSSFSGKTSDRAQLASLISAAGGQDAPPAGNVLLRLRVRPTLWSELPYGGLTWCRLLASRLGAGSLARAVVEVVADLLASAGARGVDLHFEQVCVVHAKDPAARAPALAPELHADMEGGPLQSAIASVFEPGWSAEGGTLFVPNRTMAEFPPRSIGPDQLRALIDPSDEFRPGSGDLVIYDGMIGPDGRPSRANGVPHLSLDQPGRSSRLVLMMEHRSSASSA